VLDGKTICGVYIIGFYTVGWGTSALLPCCTMSHQSDDCKRVTPGSKTERAALEPDAKRVVPTS